MKTLEAGDRDALLATLEARFKQHSHRHPGVEWADVRGRLLEQPGKLRSLGEMERSGGEPDVIGQREDVAEYLFVDCSAESPSGRRSLCYDRAARQSRKTHRPASSAVEVAAAMGAALLDEEEYRSLQARETFDARTSSWLRTPPEIRDLGGAIFGDHRFGTVWVYHNGAESYYAARGVRCGLRV